jgi:uncharacterized protein (TIGR03435 family)
MRIVVQFGLALAQIGLFGAGPGFGQNPSRREFEVASVRPTRLDPATVIASISSGITVRVGKQIRGDRVEYVCMSLGQLICEAYDVSPLLVVGPDWIQSKRFDVFCKRPEGSRKEDIPAMLQALLADRFKLVTHREVKEQGVAALIIGKQGSKLRETPPEPPEGLEEGQEMTRLPVEGARQNRDSSVSIRDGAMAIRSTIKDVSKANALVRIEATGMTIARLADLLTRWNAGGGRLVVDATGLDGRYDISLDMPVAQMGSAMSTTGPAANANETGPGEGASDPSGGSLLLRSLRNLGLDLADRKMAVVKLIIDRLEKTPTEN